MASRLRPWPHNKKFREFLNRLTLYMIKQIYTPNATILRNKGTYISSYLTYLFICVAYNDLKQPNDNLMCHNCWPMFYDCTPSTFGNIVRDLCGTRNPVGALHQFFRRWLRNDLLFILFNCQYHVQHNLKRITRIYLLI